MFIECSEAEKAFRRTESPLWWAAELPEPRCQGFLLGGGAANNNDKGRAVRACCGLVRHFYDVVPRCQGRERNTDHACLISCQYDCTKSSYNDLNFVQKHSDHPLLGISLWNLPYLSGQQFHTLCQKIRTQVIIGQPWVTSEWRHVSPILTNKMGLRESPPLVQF